MSTPSTSVPLRINPDAPIMPALLEVAFGQFQWGKPCDSMGRTDLIPFDLTCMQLGGGTDHKLPYLRS